MNDDLNFTCRKTVLRQADQASQTTGGCSKKYTEMTTSKRSGLQAKTQRRQNAQSEFKNILNPLRSLRLDAYA